MKFLVMFFCLVFLTSPIQALSDEQWEVIDSTVTLVDAEITKMVIFRDDIRTLKRLDEFINDDELILSLLAQIKTKISAAAQSIKDLLE